MAGWLDQSFWPDGIYTGRQAGRQKRGDCCLGVGTTEALTRRHLFHNLAPTEAALKSDLDAVHTFGMNMVRLHQKVRTI